MVMFTFIPAHKIAAMANMESGYNLFFEKMCTNIEHELQYA